MQAPINEAITTLETNKVFHLSHDQLKPTVRLGCSEEVSFPFSLGFVLRDESGNPIESIHAAFGTVQGIQRYLELLFMFCTQLKNSTYWETLEESDKMVIGEVLATQQLYVKKMKH
ncbi:hypothetical protein ABD91_21100 [Lysinibacillus sphaericus]|uniref:hypothetical protein n=1 Tax=Lysinibacillus sphaericus TaxID=1421 RepID=UPI0018CE6185|nr:hypothetical protein [Lysinibacillus sphaericus]MBG9693239.1 hypothetical protein [Lysinibacillus sphaericus]